MPANSVSKDKDERQLAVAEKAQDYISFISPDETPRFQCFCFSFSITDSFYLSYI